MTSSPVSDRTPARTIWRGFFTLWLPLFVLLAWWAMVHRVLPPPSAFHGPLPLPAAVALAALAAGGPALLAVLALANRKRLATVLRPRRGKIFAALALAILTPYAVFDWLPFLAGVGIPLSFISFWSDAQFIRALLLSLFFLVLVLAWYVPAALVISCIRPWKLRLFAFPLLWWSVYAAHLLVSGVRSFSL